MPIGPRASGPQPTGSPVRRVIRHKQRRLRASGGLPIRGTGRVSRFVALARPRSLGQALVELALVIPVLMVLAMAALDLGRLYYARITLENASRAAALFAAETSSGGNADTAGADGAWTVVHRGPMQSSLRPPRDEAGR